MFARARRRLALRYLVLFALVLVAFSLVFFVVLAVVLQPAFDLAPEGSSGQAARLAYGRTIERIALALVVANVLVLLLIGAAGYYLAGRTLRPIREAHDRQRRFVADASHEMRGPLTAIRSTAEAALLTPSGAAPEREALETIVTESSRLGRLTTDLLVLAQAESGLLVREPEPVDLSVVAVEALERSDFSASGTAIGVSLGPDLMVKADADDIARIVANLLDNAQRHGAAPFQLRTGSDGGFAYVEVSDRGPGLTAAEAEHVFEPFYRVRADAQSPDGAGLGLAIASQLASRSGGRLRVVSNPGTGATFRLDLPLLR